MAAFLRHPVICLLAMTLCASGAVNALKFILVPMNANSPALDLMAVGAKLIERGHKVAVVVSDMSVDHMKRAAARHSSNTTGEAFTFIPVDIGLPAVEGATTNLTHLRSSMMDKFSAPTTFWQSLMIGPQMLYLMRGFVAKPCKHVLADPKTLQALKDFKPDAIMALSLPVTAAGVSDSCGCMMSHALNTTFIDLFYGLQSSVGPEVPQYASGLSAAALKRPLPYLLNLLMWAVQRAAVPLWEAIYPDDLAAVRRDLGLPQAESQLLLKRLVDRLKGVTTRKCESVKEVQAINWLIEHPTTLKPNQVMVGPGTARPARPITPPEVTSFVDTATSGLVLVAVGSTYQSAALLSVQDVKELAAAFNLLSPVRVLMAMGNSHLPGGLKVEDLELNDNVMTVPWVDYNDVLGHPNTKLIVSHGGVHSVYEAAFHGVPMVAMPFMYEAVEYAEKYISHGAGVMCHQAPVFRRNKPDMTYTRQHIQQLMNKVLTEPKYTEAAQAMSVAMQTYAKRRHPYERAADEIELVLYTHYAQHGQHLDSRIWDTGSSGGSGSSSKAMAVDSSSCVVGEGGVAADGGGSGGSSGAVAVDSSSCIHGEDHQHHHQQQQL